MAITLFHVCHEYVIIMSSICHKYVINMPRICHEYVINLMGLISLTNRSNFWVDTKFLEKRISFPILCLLKENFSSLAGTSIGRQKNPTLSPTIRSPNQKRKNRVESFLFLVECKKIFSALQNYKKCSQFT